MPPLSRSVKKKVSPVMNSLAIANYYLKHIIRGISHFSFPQAKGIWIPGSGPALGPWNNERPFAPHTAGALQRSWDHRASQGTSWDRETSFSEALPASGRSTALCLNSVLSLVHTQALENICFLYFCYEEWFTCSSFPLQSYPFP